MPKSEQIELTELQKQSFLEQFRLGQIQAPLIAGKVYQASTQDAQAGFVQFKVQLDPLLGPILDIFKPEFEAYAHYSAPVHLRILPDGNVAPLENYQGLWGISVKTTEAETQAEHSRVSAHNDAVREVLRKKGFSA